MMRLLLYAALAIGAFWLAGGLLATIDAVFGAIFWWMFP